MNTVFAPKALAVEALALTAKNLTTMAPYDTTPTLYSDKRQPPGPDRVMECPDDPETTREVPTALSLLWSEAISLQNLVGIYQLLRVEKIKEPAPCLPYDLASTRLLFANTLEHGALGRFNFPTNGTEIALTRSRYYPHVLKLLLTTAAEINFPHASGVISNKIVELQNRYADESATAKAHLPDGVRCADFVQTVRE